MVLKGLILNSFLLILVSIGCSGLERTDFLTVAHIGQVYGSLEITDFDQFAICGRVWWS